MTHIWDSNPGPLIYNIIKLLKMVQDSNPNQNMYVQTMNLEKVIMNCKCQKIGLDS